MGEFQTESSNMREENCVMGCKHYTGGEIKHHKDCVFYPDSLTMMYDDLFNENKKLREACKTVVDGYESDGMEGMGTRDDVFYKYCKEALTQINKNKKNMVRLNTAYDYDMTLEDALWGEKNPIKKQTQARARRDVELGYNVFIITKRCKDKADEANPVYETAKELGIPIENVIFTCFKEKVRALRENNIDLFLEDEEQSLMITRAATFTSVVSVFERFNKGLHWEDALDMEEKKLIKFYNRTIHIGGDHGGFATKANVRQRIETRFDDVVDYGCPDEESCDYPDYGKKVSEAVQQSAKEGGTDFGILFCSTGQGMAMTANRFPGVRAALCWDVDVARLAREHNNANVLCIPSKHLKPDEIEDIIFVFFTTQFEGGRHQRRINKIEHED